MKPWIFIAFGLAHFGALALILRAASRQPPQGVQHGKASWYGNTYRGKIMANGEPFDPDAMTCASNDYPLGTRLRVTYMGTVIHVTVTDRGPRKDLCRMLDLSREAFRCLAHPKVGVIWVEAEAL